MLISVIMAVIAGGCFAAAGVLQQRVASSRPDDESLTPRLLLDLLRQPLWLAGITMAVLSYAFESVALAFGPLAVVQPLIVTELLFAIPISVRLHKLRLGVREWVGAVAVAGGLAVGVVSSEPGHGNPLQPVAQWFAVLGAVIVLAGAAVLLGRRIEGAVRASLFAFAGAAVMGSQSGLLSATIALLKKDHWLLFAHWEPYVMVLFSIIGLLLLQSAFQAGPLAASMPVVDATEPIVAIGIGIALFHEAVHTGFWNLLGTAIGLAALFGGIVLLDTSPVVQRLQRAEAEEREDADADDSVGLSDLGRDDAAAGAQHGGG